MSKIPESLVECKCPRCGHIWYEDVEQLKREGEQLTFKWNNLPEGVSDFRRSCPKCGTNVIVGVKEEDGHA
jgi:ssDNA-binding Zn-finger/Zn-ribbon topoisomerase 1